MNFVFDQVDSHLPQPWKHTSFLSSPNYYMY